MPEKAPVLFHESFDESYYPGCTNTELLISGVGIFDQSWSAYALQRSGSDLLSYLIPGVDVTGHTNLASAGAGGAFRFWVHPYWSTSDGGPGYHAQLLQLIAVGSGPSVLVWSLQTSTNGSALQLIQESDSGPVQLLAASIDWTSNQWHQITLDYSTNNGTVLYIDGTNAATGYGTLAIPPASAELVLGSDFSGLFPANADFDEFFSFGAQLTDA